MAFVKQEKPFAYPIAGAQTIVDERATNSVQANVMSGSCALHVVMIDCTLNPKEPIYLKIKNATSISATNACQPDHQYYCPAGEKISYSIPEGLSFGTGMSYYVSKEAGVGGTTNPSGIVKVYMVVNA